MDGKQNSYLLSTPETTSDGTTGIDSYLKESGSETAPPALKHQWRGGKRNSIPFSTSTGEDEPTNNNNNNNCNSRRYVFVNNKVNDRSTNRMIRIQSQFTLPRSSSSTTHNKGISSSSSSTVLLKEGTPQEQHVEEGTPQANASTTAPVLTRRTAILYKTVFCPWYSRGCCFAGTNCNYAHDANELRIKPDFHRTRFCKEFSLTGSCRDAACTFAHSLSELRCSRGGRRETGRDKGEGGSSSSSRRRVDGGGSSSSVLVKQECSLYDQLSEPRRETVELKGGGAEDDGLSNCSIISTSTDAESASVKSSCFTESECRLLNDTFNNNPVEDSCGGSTRCSIASHRYGLSSFGLDSHCRSYDDKSPPVLQATSAVVIPPACSVGAAHGGAVLASVAESHGCGASEEEVQRICRAEGVNAAVMHLHRTSGKAWFVPYHYFFRFFDECDLTQARPDRYEE